MADRPAGVLFQLRQLLETHAAQNLTDGQLLTRYTSQRDEAAFAALMQRHGPVVYGVCRHVLGHEQDAEDAFQGTFLVLARKAASIRQRSSVAGWLHGVAYRLALKARQSAARRRHRESQSARPEEDRPPSEEAWRELQAILDEELQRLPDKYRTPFILCVLQGRSKAEAARELEWKEGTVSSRLAQARKVLQARLGRRGVTLSAVLCGLAVAEQGSQAAVPASLGALALRLVEAVAASQPVAEGSVPAAALADGLLRSMAVTRFKECLAVFLILLLFGSAGAFLLWRPRDPMPPLLGPATRLPLKEPDRPENQIDDRGQMLVRGQVTGPDNKPVPGADVAVIADEIRPPGERSFKVFSRLRVLGKAKADAEGRFQLSVRRSTPDRDYAVLLLARGGSRSVALESLRTLLELEPTAMKLEAGQQVRGRLVNAAGAPAAGVRLRVGQMARLGRPLSAARMEEELGVEAWPPPAVTDADGRFVLTGLPSLCTVHLESLDERFAPQWLSVRTDKTGEADAGTIMLAPPRVLQGTVVDRDTGQPLEKAHVHVASIESSQIRGHVSAHTNAEGHFVVKPYPGEMVSLTACGAAGSPFLVGHQSLKWPASSRSETVQFKLRRGILVQGRVVEEATKKPVSGARIEYRPLSGKNRHMDGGTQLTLWPWLDACSDADGRFQLPVLPGPGHLLVRGPGHDYLAMEVSERELIDGVKGGGRLYLPHALVSLDLKPGEEAAPVVANLRRGVTVTGRAVTADGRPVATGFLLSQTFRAHGWESHSDFLPIKNGRFEIPGCDPARGLPVWFWDHKALQGAVVEISGKDQDRDVHLAPFGSASVRFVDSKGDVLRKLRIYVKVVVRPGMEDPESWSKGGPLRLTKGADFQGWREDPTTGVVTLRALIPDATYLVECFRGAQITGRTFSVPAGEHLQLEDIVVPEIALPKLK